MAWRFKVAGKNVTKNGVELRVDYYDDADPTLILETQQFQFDPSTLKGEALGEIRLHGRKVRDDLAQAQSLGAVVNVGDDLVV